VCEISLRVLVSGFVAGSCAQHFQYIVKLSLLSNLQICAGIVTNNMTWQHWKSASKMAFPTIKNRTNRKRQEESWLNGTVVRVSI